MKSSDPSRSPVHGSVDGTVSNSESVSSKRRKRKNKINKLHDAIQKHIDDIMGDQQPLETPSKRKKLVKKQLTFSSGPEYSDNQKSKNQRKRKNVDETQINNKY